MRLQDKVTIVTGAGSGIGRATALLFAREGARLVLNDIDPQGLEAVLTDLSKENGRAIVGDVAQEETARRLAQEAVSAFGHIDVLVNSAGVFFEGDHRHDRQGVGPLDGRQSLEHFLVNSGTGVAVIG
jgi:NAD(P)-dependent dehydrogenase (short-subunit alcohol dehydrogenase family)